MNTKINSIQIEQGLQNASGILRNNLRKFTKKFPDHSSENNFYKPVSNRDWTNGFCTGSYWLAYELTGDEEFKNSALVQVNSFLRRVQRGIMTDTHDLGFLYTLSCVAAHKLCGSEKGKKAALLAADRLMLRFREKGQFFQAWGKIGEAENHRMIIDCLMNMPLLFWASETTGNAAFAEKAAIHNTTAAKHLIREDNSTIHTFFFDIETGKPLRGVTHQGYRDNSAWSRGQAWGVYGLALAYKYTRSPELTELFFRVTDYFISHLPGDLIPYWDLCFSDGSGEEKDSSAAAIAACGMLEMAKYLPEQKALYYTEIAKQIAFSLHNGYAVKSEAQSNGLLLHGVYGKSSPFNNLQSTGVDECNLWGDYFWLELLMRLHKDWEPYW